MDIFQRGDYRAFIVVASAADKDRALFAFPVFEGQEVSDVFQLYKYLYLPDAAQLSMRTQKLDDPQTLGAIFADVEVGTDKFIISTITPRKALWLPVVAAWEDNWVFNHLLSSQGKMPEKDPRKFSGGIEVQERVMNSYSHYLKMYIWAAITAFAAWMVMSSTFNKDNQQ